MSQSNERSTSPHPNAQAQQRPMMGGGPRGPMAMMPGEKAKNFRKTLKALIEYLRKERIGIVAVFACAVASSLFAILGPMILGLATTAIFDGFRKMIAGSGGIDFAYIGKVAVVLLALYSLSSGFAFVQGFAMSGIAMRVSARMRDDIEAKLHRLPFRYFDSRSRGDVLSLVTNDVDTVTQSLNQGLTQIVTAVATMTGILVMMFSISWQMTVVSLVVIPLSFLFVRFSVGKSQPHFKSQQAGIARINGLVEELYGNHIVMKAYNGEDAALAAFDEENGKLYRSVWKAQFLSGLMPPVMGFLANVGYVAVCVVGGYLAIAGKLAVGNIQAFVQYVRQFNQPITQVANMTNILQSMAAAAERVFEFLAEQDERADPDLPVSVGEGKAVRGSVEFSHVRFGYTEAKTVIKDFSEKIEPGQKVAIVGPTGAGKTTLVKLLMRFYDPDSGVISVDGTDVLRATRAGVRSSFGMVLQDTWLYSASIRENIRYGRPGASDDEVIAAARAAQADHFIHTLPRGYDFELNEDATNISRGQKQLLTIARVILADPKILILDEATSSVDTRTEILIQKAMDALMSGRTSFVIAHRLSTVKNADVILVLNEGDIVEQGTHESLLAAGGFYAGLYRSQFDASSEESGR